ncbi:hypothetical protein [Halorubellus sp. PRR65]|uniref:hypothetical protein n=1 Tax=Halorubellus sp. PRR65 TaxID=3098148 RepID=UPI002B2608C9|nr:hypothetical protein [Halorubellus sp. PRR65]
MLVGAALLVALVTVLTDYATTGQVPTIVAGLGALVAAVLLVVAAGLWRTSTWARPLGVLAYALAGLVGVTVAASVDAWIAAAPTLAGNALARHTTGFEEGDRRPEEVNAHVGR